MSKQAANSKMIVVDDEDEDVGQCLDVAVDDDDFIAVASTEQTAAVAEDKKAVKKGQSKDGNDEGSDDDGYVPPPRKAPFHGARDRAEAGRMMMASHTERMQHFVLPDETITAPRSSRSPAYCVECEFSSMCQMPMAGPCSYCKKKQITTNLWACEACATAKKRCAACGKRFA